MNRRWIICLVVAISAAAQTPAVSSAEKALRARAEQFFQYQVEAKYRAAESLVAKESKDEYYAAHKPPIEGFKLGKVEFLAGGKRATVTVISKAKVMIMGSPPQTFDVPSLTSWKLEGGKWCWYMDKELFSKTPFGTAKPSPAASSSSGLSSSGSSSPTAAFQGMAGAAPSVEDLQKSVQITPQVVELIPGGAPKTVAVLNSIPGTVIVTLAVRTTPIPGLTTEAKTLTLGRDQKGEFTFEAAAGAKFDETLTFLVEPFNRSVSVEVKTISGK